MKSTQNKRSGSMGSKERGLCRTDPTNPFPIPKESWGRIGSPTLEAQWRHAGHYSRWHHLLGNREQSQVFSSLLILWKLLCFSWQLSAMDLQTGRVLTYRTIYLMKPQWQRPNQYPSCPTRYLETRRRHHTASPGQSRMLSSHHQNNSLCPLP